jgi:hypothetical protein
MRSGGDRGGWRRRGEGWVDRLQPVFEKGSDGLTGRVVSKTG